MPPTRTARHQLVRSLGLAGAVAASLGAPAAAVAAPVTFDDQASTATGASLTIDEGVYTPGERIMLTGGGFHATSGTIGSPVVAIKPNEGQWHGADHGGVEDWSYGGANAVPDPGGPAGEDYASFAASLGGFGGWVRIPGDLPAGGHTLRILSGALSTGDARTDPVTFQGRFDVVDLRLGLRSTAGPSPGTFYGGRTFPAGANVVLEATGLAASAAVGVTIDGAPYGGAPLATDAGGALPASARLTLPAGIAAGDHRATFTIGADVVPVRFQVAPAPTAVVLTPVVAAGGALTIRLANWVGIRGDGQTVAVKVNGADPPAGCARTDASGNADVTVPLPASIAPGPATINLLAGTRCVAGGVQDDLPGRGLNPPPTVTVTAPAAPPPPPGPGLPGPSLPPGGDAPSPRATTPSALSARLVNGRRGLRLSLGAATATRVRITVRSRGPVRAGARSRRARVVAVTAPRTVSRVAGRAGSVTLTVTRDGRAALARLARLPVVVRIAPLAGGARATSRTFTLRR